MKVLWFNMQCPGAYKSGGVLGGWQDSLELVVKSHLDIELFVAFKGEGETVVKDGVTYIPIDVKFSRLEKVKNLFTWTVEAEKLAAVALKTLEKIRPDVVHVFGTEWPFGLVARRSKVPLVVHIQGVLSACYEAKYPPGYNAFTYVMAMRGNLLRYAWYGIQSIKQKSRGRMERTIMECVGNYMGRTRWDEAVSYMCNPTRKYFHVDEALRPAFMNNGKAWTPFAGGGLLLVTTGCSTLYKGLDMVIKTAAKLKALGVDFEWHLVGKIPNEFRRMVEYKEKRKFLDCNIHVRGFMQPEPLTELLCQSTMYVHCSYIDNSPNALCEAQVLGVPVISTNVGGISSLVEDGVDGVLVPANDSYRMAYEITKLSQDIERLRLYGERGRAKALKRHSPEAIARDLMACYNQLATK